MTDDQIKPDVQQDGDNPDTVIDVRDSSDLEVLSELEDPPEEDE